MARSQIKATVETSRTKRTRKKLPNKPVAVMVGIVQPHTSKEQKMVSTVVLLNVEPDKINEVATEVAEINGVSEVFSVAGRFDLVAIVRVKNNEKMAEVVTERMLKVPGITNSETLIAFRVFSRHDLESMFSIGME